MGALSAAAALSDICNALHRLYICTVSKLYLAAHRVNGWRMQKIH